MSCPPPGDLSDPGIELGSICIAGGFFTSLVRVSYSATSLLLCLTDQFKTVKNIPSIKRMKHCSLSLSFLVTVTFQSCLSDCDLTWDSPNLIIYLFFFAMLCGLWDLSYLTRD